MRKDEELKLQLPTPENPVVKFGTFGKQIVQEWRSHDEADNGRALEYMPLFEKYYFQSVAYKYGYYEYATPLDDFMASIGRFSMHFCAIGAQQYIDGKNVKVVIYSTIGFIENPNLEFELELIP
ncbi:MAG: hypothetical protein LBE89_02205 [Helicobacteraceae bacterium]|jgi:hypothetical protein|nr:hypothetical protein [Helicobacteraceae bacterium]